MGKNGKKIEDLQVSLSGEGIDCVVIGPGTNMRYFLGGSPHADERLCLLLVNSDDAQIIVPRLNAKDMEKYTDLKIIAWTDSKGPEAALAESFLNGKKINTIAVDGSMRADFLLPLLSKCNPGKVISADPVISRLRIKKSAREIAALKKAALQADRIMQKGIDACRPGVKEEEVAWLIEEAFRKDGAESVEFTLVASGANASSPHHKSGEKKLRKGEGVLLDIGASLNGYKSDISRVVFLGEPDREFLEIYEIVRTANRLGRSAVKPAAIAGDVDRGSRQFITEAGFGDFFIHRTGHGLGLDIHEPPWVMDGSSVSLEEGMVFSIEPGIYLPDKLGVRIEDIVVVTKEGVLELTEFSRSLMVKD